MTDYDKSVEFVINKVIFPLILALSFQQIVSRMVECELHAVELPGAAREGDTADIPVRVHIPHYPCAVGKYGGACRPAFVVFKAVDFLAGGSGGYAETVIVVLMRNAEAAGICG